MSELSGEWGARIKARREELGLTPEDLASRLGVHMTTVYAWERGAVKRWEPELLRDIAAALETTGRYLFPFGDEVSE